ncbi:nitroreductase family protein [Sphingomonas morindae]|uniref:Putative NAD(P)H nitroreductase n=1 Tax=Sphingomonas morindae TaxID=1541170 RepID=A0ABY4XA65_9SPHN|nr:nitroreductase [Sphingomonas morindae]USI73862.1 nitroreductase [Sphingomonas morindae]
MFNDLSSPASLVASRRSAKPRDLVAPGPDAAQLRRILAAAMRVPDHGKLAPWRLVVIGADRRDAFAALLKQCYRADKPDAAPRELEALDQFAHQAPVLVALLSTPAPASAIPLWEQELSAGAAGMMLLTAAHAEGFAGGWLTGWPSYGPGVAEGLGHPGARIAGYFFLGTPARPLEERPRPDYDAIVSHF